MEEIYRRKICGSWKSISLEKQGIYSPVHIQLKWKQSQIILKKLRGEINKMETEKFKIEFKVFDTDMTQEEFADYLVEVFQIGKQMLKNEEVKKFFWDLPSKYSKE